MALKVKGRRMLLSSVAFGVALSGALGAASMSMAQEATTLDEVVVTASKTGEAVREVSGGVTAFTGADLDAMGAQSAADYLAQTPGVTFNRQGAGFSTITVRGVGTSTSFANLSQGTTGSYINGVPLTDPYFSAGTPDIDTFDVRTVEIYRGPQGTLFGSSALGGAVNYVANRPDLVGFDAAAQATVSTTENASEPNSAVKLMVNLPLVDDVLAVRAVAILRDDQGYIDNAGTGVDGANDSTVSGGRFMIGWTPASGTRLDWLSLYQQTRNADAGQRNPDLGDLTKFTNVPEPTRAEVQIHSLTLEQALPVGTLTAQVAYHRKDAEIDADLKRFGLLGFVNPYLTDLVESEGYTAEVRLAAHRGQPFQWVIGAMIDKTDVDVLETAYAANAAAVGDALLGPGGGAASTVGDSWGVAQNAFAGREIALFGEAAYTFNERLRVTLGGRLFRTESDSDSSIVGLLSVLTNGLLASNPPTASQREEGFNPKASISYDLTPSARVYALASRGFRFGGSNINPDPALPANFGSDSLWNYEVGLRSDWLDGDLTLDLSGFFIDWTDIPLTVNTASGTVGVLNAGDAEIRGVEADLTWRITPQFTFNSAVTYLDTELVSVASTAGVSFGVTPGSRLPATPEWRAASSLRYDWGGSHDVFAMVAHRYASAAPALLQQYAAPGRNAQVGDYHLIDIRAGATFGQTEVTVFIENLADERAVLSGSYLAPPLANEILDYVARPRTVGVTLGWKL